MPEKKRKSEVQDSERPAKKAQKPSKIVVKHVSGSDIAKPVVVTLPGLTLPQRIQFKSFARKHDSGSSDLLLQSSDHPTIDYSAVECSTINSAEKHLRHYIALYDSETSTLEVVEAKNLAVRSCVRRLEPEKDSDESDGGTQPVTNYSSRMALTEAFGTKKSKKAVQLIAENRLLAKGGEEDNALSNAFLNAVDDTELDNINDPLAHRANKPLPQANVETKDINQVYTLEALVFPQPPAETLEAMPLAYWLDRIGQDKAVKSHYRYIANRVAYLTKAHLSQPSEQTKLALQLLRYIQLLLEVAKYVATLPNRRRIPPPASWPPKTTSESIPLPLLSQALTHFFPTQIPTSHAVTLLRTTILALTLQIPPPSFNSGTGTLITDPTDVSLDMAIDRKEISKLYRELGCEMRTATDADLQRWGLPKAARSRATDASPGSARAGGERVKFAWLKLPLKFPSVSQGRRPGGR